MVHGYTWDPSSPQLPTSTSREGSGGLGFRAWLRSRDPSGQRLILSYPWPSVSTSEKWSWYTHHTELSWRWVRSWVWREFYNWEDMQACNLSSSPTLPDLSFPSHLASLAANVNFLFSLHQTTCLGKHLKLIWTLMFMNNDNSKCYFPRAFFPIGTKTLS